MEMRLDNNSYVKADKALTEGVVNDLNSFLSAIKGRTYLMKHSVHESNPIQKHLEEIIYCINESIEAASILSDFAKVDEDFKVAE